MSRPPADVAAVLAAYPRPIRVEVLALRSLILHTAEKTPGVGAIEETLKWGEPAYLTSASGSGSTIRLAWKRATRDRFGMFFNCKTTLVDTFRTHFPDSFVFEGNRALIFPAGGAPSRDALTQCIATALLYHRLPGRTLAPHS